MKIWLVGAGIVECILTSQQAKRQIKQSLPLYIYLFFFNKDRLLGCKNEMWICLFIFVLAVMKTTKTWHRTTKTFVSRVFCFVLCVFFQQDIQKWTYSLRKLFLNLHRKLLWLTTYQFFSWFFWYNQCYNLQQLRVNLSMNCSYS